MNKIDSYGEIRDAILGNKILNARTTYTSEDGRMRYRLDYPVVVCNVPHDQEGWQIDTGPMLVPDPGLSGPPDPDFSSPLPITCLNLGYIVFNSVDWAEIALRRPTGVGTGGGATQHFSKIVRLNGVTNEIFCAC
ncbi:MAG TPA: hypothetical protein VMX75_11030 [Spirochaetia bacterium]|nr:hypothetical protein [Spirochaetia bacterium]